MSGLLRKTDSGKLIDQSVEKFLKKAPNPKDIELNEKLQRLKAFNNNLAADHDSDNDSDGGVPPLSPLPPASNFSPLSEVPQFQPDISQPQAEPKSETEHFSEIKEVIKQEEKPLISDKFQRLVKYVKKRLQKLRAKTKFLFLTCKKLLQN